MKNIITLLIIFVSTFNVSAQSDPMFTHYAFNTMAVNPAYAGNRGMFSATLLHRSQWIGVEGAPTTQTLTINSPIYKNTLAMGLSVMNDRIGPVNTFSANVDIAYMLKLNSKNRLAFGIKGGITQFDRNLSSLTSTSTGDIAIANSSRNDLTYDFGFGLLYTNEHFYIGLSTPKILLSNYRNSINNVDPLGAKEVQNFYFTAGGIFNLSKKIEWKPATFVRATYGAPITADLTNMLIFNKKFEIGAMWRWNDAVGILIGYTFKESLRIGYSYDFSYNFRTITYNQGSHEVMLRYDLFYRGSKSKITSPRYF
ncbi:MAG: type IX secretion system membrane protein PorP/SprF [Fluviicola sp.]|nr:type IX secretion system membrane protein PorP/SprF [Fluviicola sp.]